MRRQLATLLRRIADRLYKEPVIVTNIKFGHVYPNGEIFVKDTIETALDSRLEGIQLLGKPLPKPIPPYDSPFANQENQSDDRSPHA